MDKKHRRNISGRGMERSNLIGAGALIYCRSTHRYLFLLRNSARHSGSWGLVGGKIETDETVTAGLIREIEEELGGTIKDAKLIPIEKFTSDSNFFEYHTFQITVEEEFVPILNHEHRGYCWVQLEDHPKPLHPGVWRTFKFGAVIDKIKTLEAVLS